MPNQSAIPMPTPYTAIQVANYFIKRSLDSNQAITPMQVIKMTYIAHGFALAIYNSELFDENAEAWEYGPVIPSVYSALRHYGSKNITNPIKTDITQEFDKNSIVILEYVWDIYHSFSGIQLSMLTHQNGTPWHQVVNSKGYDKFFSNQMPDKLIRKYYLDFLQLNEKKH